MRAWLLVLAGCGRIGFDARGDAGTGTFVHSTLSLEGPAAPLTDFPLPVFLDDTRAARDRIGDGSDLRFVDVSGKVLPHEIEQLGAPGGPPLIAWVRVPQLAGPMTIEVRYGGDTGPDNQDIVWTGAYAAVWHFASDGIATDSTANHHDAMASGTHAADAAIGQGREFDAGSQEYLLVPSLTTFAASAHTISGWLWARTLPSGFFGMLTRQYGVNGDNDIYLGIVGGQPVSTCESGNVEYDAVGGSVATQQFHLLTAVATATVQTVYLDGAMVGQDAIPGPLQASTHPMFIGADKSDATGSDSTPCCDYLDGIVDELRLENVARPPEWIAYDSRAQHDQVITYGPVIGP